MWSHLLATSVISPCEPCVDFQWGDKDGATFCKLIGDAFEVVVHWRCNSFLVPFAKAGRDFVLELARLYHAYADNTTLHSIAFTACCVFQVLLLQKPCARSISKDHVHCLEHHLELWHHGDIDSLVKEGKCIQDHLQSTIHSGPKSASVARKFDQLMKLGKVTAALKLLSTDVKGVLPLNSKILCGQDGDVDAVQKSVRDILAEKHPPGWAAVSDSLLESDSIDAHFV